MQIEIGRRLPVDLLEERQELLGAMARQAFADDLAGRHVERGEQRGGAVALVVVGHGAGAALLEGQAGLGAIERLDLALLVDSKHQRAGRAGRDRGRRCP